MGELLQFKQCSQCGIPCGSEIAKCPECGSASFNSITTQQLLQLGDNGKIKAYFQKIPNWPSQDAWSPVVTRADLGQLP